MLDALCPANRLPMAVPSPDIADFSSDLTRSIFPAKSTAPVDESSDPVCEDTCLYWRSACDRCS